MKLTSLIGITAHIHDLSGLLKKTKGDPEAFYSAGGRNIFFRLETIARIGSGLGDKDHFEEARHLFKEAEDLLGEYDFYVAYLNLFKENKNCVFAFLEIFGDQLKESESVLRDNLKKWLAPSTTEIIGEFYKRCEEVSFEDESDFTKAFSRFLKKSAEKINHDYSTGVYNTSDIEAGLHELRRKLRWISLYIQISGGIIQHHPSQHTEEKFNRYLTKEIKTSPFMQLSKHPTFKNPVILRTEIYAALSWMIATLGRYKDEALTLALFDHHPPLKNCYELTTPEELTEKAILKQVSEIADQFFKVDRIIHELIRDLNSYC